MDWVGMYLVPLCVCEYRNESVGSGGGIEKFCTDVGGEACACKGGVFGVE